MLFRKSHIRENTATRSCIIQPYCLLTRQVIYICIYTYIYTPPYYRKLPKFTPYFAHYFEAKVGRGCLLKDSICLWHMPISSILRNNTLKVNNCSDCGGFMEGWQLCWMCTTENQKWFCWYKLRDIEATCTISDDGG